MPLDQEVTDVVDLFVSPVHVHPNPFFPAIEITGVNRFILPVQGHDYFCRMDTHVGHFVLQKLHVYARLAFAIHIHTAYPVNIQHGTTNQFGIIRHFLVIKAIGRHGIKHPVHVPEVVHHDGRLSPLRQLGLHTHDFPA